MIRNLAKRLGLESLLGITSPAINLVSPPVLDLKAVYKKVDKEIKRFKNEGEKDRAIMYALRHVLLCNDEARTKEVYGLLKSDLEQSNDLWSAAVFANYAQDAEWVSAFYKMHINQCLDKKNYREALDLAVKVSDKRRANYVKVTIKDNDQSVYETDDAIELKIKEKEMLLSNSERRIDLKYDLARELEELKTVKILRKYFKEY